jgi:hypothetical protein
MHSGLSRLYAGVHQGRQCLGGQQRNPCVLDGRSTRAPRWTRLVKTVDKYAVHAVVSHARVASGLQGSGRRPDLRHCLRERQSVRGLCHGCFTAHPDTYHPVHFSLPSSASGKVTDDRRCQGPPRHLALVCPVYPGDEIHRFPVRRQGRFAGPVWLNLFGPLELFDTSGRVGLNVLCTPAPTTPTRRFSSRLSPLRRIPYLPWTLFLAEGPALAAQGGQPGLWRTRVDSAARRHGPPTRPVADKERRGCSVFVWAYAL